MNSTPTNKLQTLSEQAKQAGIMAGEPFPTEVRKDLGDGSTTCLFHRQHQWSEKYYAPLMPLCAICGGRCDPRTEAHCLCVELQKRGLPVRQLDSFSPCGCSACSKKAQPSGPSIRYGQQMIMNPSEIVASWPFEKQLETVAQCLADAEAKAIKTGDPIDIAVVEEWQQRYHETLAQGFKFLDREGKPIIPQAHLNPAESPR